MNEKKNGSGPDRYEDFLDDLSHFSAKDEENILQIALVAFRLRVKLF